MPSRLPMALSIREAGLIAGTLGQTTKMPGRSYGLDAFQCIAGSKLAEVRGSTCENCYARRSFYRTWWPARMARAKRMQALDHPRWVDAMVVLIHDGCSSEPFFRWHDSGDLMSVEHLANICKVAARTFVVQHWLPTRELGFVEKYMASGGVVPDNLCVRLSAHMIGETPKLPRRLERFATSTVHAAPGKPIRFSIGRPGDSIECGAFKRDNQCGSCRACWSTRVQNVSYLAH